MKKRLKKLLCLLLSVFILISILAGLNLSVNAQTSGDFEYEVLDDGTLSLIDYTGADTDVIVPATLEKYRVKEIDYGTFDDCETLKSVTFSEGIESVYCSFSNCPELVTVNLSSTVKYLDTSVCVFTNGIITESGDNAENYIMKSAGGNLKNINVSVDNPYFCSLDGVLFSKNMETLLRYPAGKSDTVYEIPETVKSFSSLAFAYAGNLSKLVIPASVEDIQNNQFGLFNYIKTNGYNNIVQMESSFQEFEVDEDNSKYCSVDGILYSKNMSTLVAYPSGKSVKEFSADNRVEEIGMFAFAFNQVEKLDMSNIKIVSPYAFYQSSNLKTITLSEKCESIGAMAFGYCAQLESLSVPNGITIIDVAVFMNCTGLKSVEIPKSVAVISEKAFEQCTSLTEIYYSGSEYEWDKIVVNSDNTAFDFATIYFVKETPLEVEDIESGITVSADALEILPADTELVVEKESGTVTGVSYNIRLIKDGKEIQPNGTVTVKILVPEEMDRNACKVYRQEEDGTYTDMNAVYQNGYMVFATDHFSRYVLTESDPYDTGATANEFEYTVLNDSTIAITKYNGNDTILMIPSQIDGHLVTSINGFDSNYSIEEVWIPNTVTTIGYAAFYDCKNLKCVVIGSGITEIPESAFKYCFSLEKIVISDSVKSIPKMTFWDAKIDAIIYGYKDSEAENYQHREMHAASNFYVLPNVTDDGKLDLYYSIDETIINEVLFSLYLNMEAKSIEVKDSEGNSITNTEQSVLPGMIFDVTLDDGTKLAFSIPNAINIGDVTGDGIVDSADAVMIQRYDAGLIDLTTQQLQAADVTGDGTVDAADAVRIQRYDAGLIPSL